MKSFVSSASCIGFVLGQDSTGLLQMRTLTNLSMKLHQQAAAASSCDSYDGDADWETVCIGHPKHMMEHEISNLQGEKDGKENAIKSQQVSIDYAMTGIGMIENRIVAEQSKLAAANARLGATNDLVAQLQTTVDTNKAGLIELEQAANAAKIKEAFLSGAFVTSKQSHEDNCGAHFDELESALDVAGFDLASLQTSKEDTFLAFNTAEQDKASAQGDKDSVCAAASAADAAYSSAVSERESAESLLADAQQTLKEAEDALAAALGATQAADGAAATALTDKQNAEQLKKGECMEAVNALSDMNGVDDEHVQKVAECKRLRQVSRASGRVRDQRNNEKRMANMKWFTAEAFKSSKKSQEENMLSWKAQTKNFLDLQTTELARREERKGMVCATSAEALITVKSADSARIANAIVVNDKLHALFSANTTRGNRLMDQNAQCDLANTLRQRAGGASQDAVDARALMELNVEYHETQVGVLEAAQQDYDEKKTISEAKSAELTTADDTLLQAHQVQEDNLNSHAISKQSLNLATQMTNAGKIARDAASDRKDDADSAYTTATTRFNTATRLFEEQKTALSKAEELVKLCGERESLPETENVDKLIHDMRAAELDLLNIKTSYISRQTTLKERTLAMEDAQAVLTDRTTDLEAASASYDDLVSDLAQKQQHFDSEVTKLTTSSGKLSEARHLVDQAKSAFTVARNDLSSADATLTSERMSEATLKVRMTTSTANSQTADARSTATEQAAVDQEAKCAAAQLALIEAQKAAKIALNEWNQARTLQVSLEAHYQASHVVQIASWEQCQHWGVQVDLQVTVKQYASVGFESASNDYDQAVIETTAAAGDADAKLEDLNAKTQAATDADQIEMQDTTNVDACDVEENKLLKDLMMAATLNSTETHHCENAKTSYQAAATEHQSLATEAAAAASAHNDASGQEVNARSEVLQRTQRVTVLTEIETGAQEVSTTSRADCVDAEALLVQMDELLLISQEADKAQLQLVTQAEAQVVDAQTAVDDQTAICVNLLEEMQAAEKAHSLSVQESEQATNCWQNGGSRIALIEQFLGIRTRSAANLEVAVAQLTQQIQVFVQDKTDQEAVAASRNAGLATMQAQLAVIMTNFNKWSCAVESACAPHWGCAFPQDIEGLSNTNYPVSAGALVPQECEDGREFAFCEKECADGVVHETVRCVNGALYPTPYCKSKTGESTADAGPVDTPIQGMLTWSHPESSANLKSGFKVVIFRGGVAVPGGGYNMGGTWMDTSVAPASTSSLFAVGVMNEQNEMVPLVCTAGAYTTSYFRKPSVDGMCVVDLHVKSGGFEEMITVDVDDVSSFILNYAIMDPMDLFR